MERDRRSWKGNSQIEDTLVKLDDLLELEREALLAGNIDGVTRRLPEKERLMNSLEAFELTDESKLDPLKRKAERNQRLLESALEGLRAVTNRISALRRIRETLETYDQSGRRTTISETRGSQVEKRA
tara:strand:- start:232 stop:615 length:384 start_codon:yes stop_codon:yes gene_type:complete